MDPLNTISDLVRHIKSLPNNPKLLNYKYEGKWWPISTHEFADHVKYLCLGLISLGVKPQDNIAIISDSSPWWLMVDFAIILSGGVTIPFFSKISDDNFIFEMDQTSPKYIFIAGEESWEKIDRLMGDRTKIITLDPNDHEQGSLSYNQVIEMGRAYHQQHPDAYELMEKKCNPESVATIIYTSGTTGNTKGAILTQRALVSIISCHIFNFDGGENSFFSMLPLAHIFARNVIYYIVARGISIYFLSDVKQLPEECVEVKPTLAIIVPRVLEKIFSKVQSQVTHSSWLKRTIGTLGIKVALMPDSWKKRLLLPLFDRIMYKKIRNILGGKMRGMISGGSHLSNQMNIFFNSVGLPVMEGWGLTEGGCVVINTPWANKIGTLGKPFSDTQVIVDGNGEILVKGPTVMLGYYKNPEETEKVLSKDGWLHTGDKGVIDEEGFISIIARIKELFKTSTGEYITPVHIEHQLTKCSLIENAVIIAEGRQYVTCLLFVNPEELKKMKKMANKEGYTDEEFLQVSKIKERTARLIQEINRHANKWEKIVDYRFIVESLSIETGELTPTMKIKRNVITKKYSHIIESMYQKDSL